MRRALTVAALAGLVIAGGLAVERVDVELPWDRPVVRSGGVGDSVAIAGGAVTVHGARTSPALEDAGLRLETRGRWILVEVSLEGTSNALDDGTWYLEDSSGRRFQATDRAGERLPIVQPGMTVRGSVVFEVADDVELSHATVIMTVTGYLEETAIRVPIEEASSALLVEAPELEVPG